MPRPKRASKPDGALRLGEFLCFAVYSANHAFNRVYKPLLDELGLTYPQYLAMVLLWEQNDQTVGSLGEKAVPRIKHAHASAQAAGGVRPRQANP
jgi:hypothetical protein